MTDEEININTGGIKKVWEFLKSKFNWFVYLLLGVILWINIYIRTLPMKINPATGMPGLWDITRNNWTLGPDLDPFLFLRWAKEIVANGALSPIDYMRYSPLGHSSLLETKVLPYLIAYFYKFLHIFNNQVTVEYAAIMLPVIASVFMTIGFFLLVRKIFEWKGNKVSNIIALISSAFLVTLPSLLPRTIAGIPEKESLGFGLMFFALYFFIWAWKSEKITKPLILGILAGIFTALMALIWGGALFVFAILAVFGFILLILEKIEKKELVVYLAWIISSIVFWLPFTHRTSLREVFTSPGTGSAVIVGFLILIYFIMFKTKLKDSTFMQKGFLQKIPKMILVLVISLIVFSIVGLILIGPQTLFDFIKGMISHLSAPYYDRLSFTVAENSRPFFSNWAANFGPMIGGIPLFFWLFIVGSIFLFKEMIRGLQKGKVVLLSGYTLSIMAIIFSRTSSSSILDGKGFLSTFVYIMGFIIFASSAIYVHYKNKENKTFETIKSEYVLLFSLIFIGILAARDAIRLLMVLAPFASIPISYLIIQTISEVKENKDDLLRLGFLVLAIVILMASSYTFYYNYKVSEATAQNNIPNQYTIQWQQAMAWVRAATPRNAVFGSWWDYGYWIQTMGERATMLDGGNSISYWDYLMGRHVLTAENESEALELLYNHNVTYYLIDSTEIGKYSAFSSIGSDENYDRFSWLGTLLFDESQTQETKDKITLVYVGGPVLDEDIIINNGTTLFPQGRAGVGGIAVSVNKSGEFEQPFAIIVYGQGQIEVNLRYLFYNGKLIDFGSGIEGAVYIFPSLAESSQGLNVNPYGAVMFLSPRNMRALWIRLYLLEEGGNFELVHTESSPLIKSLRNQGLNISSEIIYFGGFNGPIKIWEINYTGNETYNEEYLQRTYPERIKDRRDATL